MSKGQGSNWGTSCAPFAKIAHVPRCTRSNENV
uniref:Uncharacterized protein n=1 Tax=Dulem virus 31 TaxID=3145749 RepID=A0AAU8ATR3_9VIRU